MCTLESQQMQVSAQPPETLPDVRRGDGGIMPGMRLLRDAACVAVGSELLGDGRVDTNSLAVTAALARIGIRVVEKRVVGDDVGAVAAALAQLLQQVDVVVVTGGLGPTADDITREAVAAAVGRSLVLDPDLETRIRERYESLGREMPAIGSAMARVVDGSRPLANLTGSAPGLLLEVGGRFLAALPGVPWEMRGMLEQEVVPELARHTGGNVVLRRILVLGGVVESGVETRVRPLYDRFGREAVTILAAVGVVRLVLSAEGEPAAAAVRLDEMEVAFRDLLGDDVAGLDVDGLAPAVVAALAARGATVATAESCTGGLLGAEITGVSGSSTVFLGGVVSYSNEVKEAMVGVPHDLLVAHGAVSEQVARAMAEGVRTRLGADWGVGITGIAGPSGGTADKPVGLVHWAVAGPGGLDARHAVFPGDRTAVRRWSVNSALDLLRRCLR